MSRQLFCAGVLGVLTLSTLVSGCSNAPGPSSESAASGTVELPLTAQSAGTKYRLQKAYFHIEGQSLILQRDIAPPADQPIDQEVLAAGKYRITLADGWVLEAEGPGETTFSAVDAELVANDLIFNVTQGQTIDVVFEFISRGVPIKLNKGRANVRISVDDCSGYDSYAAAIAGYTVDCLGRIDQNSFLVGDDGLLHRNFTECQDDSTLLDAIDGFLGLQNPVRDPLDIPSLETDPLAFAPDCLAGRWAEWREQFDESGTSECPDWNLSGVVNDPTVDRYQALTKQLPRLPQPDTGSTPQVLGALKINSVYSLSFADPAGTDQKCGAPGSCAALCAGGFPSFVVASDQGSVETDPVPWESNKDYGTKPDPFAPSYYHPMSYYGPLPGDLFGALNRATDLENCSYYDDTIGQHVPGYLTPNCTRAPDGTATSCVSLCVPGVRPQLQ